jgi:D-sedoheptulose 7-phosphate isomerase
METIKELTARYPGLSCCGDAIEQAAELIIETYKNGGCLFTCGNGGSAADSDHIVGELMKGFLKKRPVDTAFRDKLKEAFQDDGEFLSDNLQRGLPAVSLHSQSALLTAFVNDVEPSMMYAQTLYAMGKAGDCLIAISTSGNSKNVVNAAKIAKAMGVKVISLTGNRPCRLDDLADIAIHVDDCETYRVQELHLPVYHWLCARVEDEFFPE